MQQAFFPRIKGLNPLIDRKQSAEPYVVSGKNFIVDAEGIESGFGRELLSHEAISNPTNVDVFEISETLESFICTNEGIFRLDTFSRRLVPLYVLPVVVDTQFPWTFAVVGNRYYFARPGFGLLEYDITSDSWQKLTGGSIPDNIYACEESEGRLILLTDLWAAWSTIGDGRDFTASVSTGAGAQALTKAGLSKPKPLGLKRVYDGFLVFVSSGIIRFQSIDSIVPFRSTMLSYQHVPINPYCIVKTLTQVVVILTTSGLYEIKAGQIPQVWQPILSEYLHLNILNNLDLINNQNNPRLFFNYDASWFVVALSDTNSDYLFNRAFVLNIPTNELGSLDTYFVTLAEFKLLQTQVSGFNFGMVDQDGSLYKFNKSLGIEVLPDLSTNGIYLKPYLNYAAVDNDGILYFRTNGDFRTVQTIDVEFPGAYTPYTEKEEYLSPVSKTNIERSVRVGTGSNFAIVDIAVVDIAVVDVDGIDHVITSTTFQSGIVEFTFGQLPQEYTHLNSSVLIGPFVITSEEVSNKYMQLTNTAFGMRELAVGSESDDWMDEIKYPITVGEDWLLLTGEEDWGSGIAQGVDYVVDVVPTLDGYKKITNAYVNVKFLKADGANQFYTIDANGIYNLIKISAEESNKNYHLKTMSIDFFPGGNL